MSAETVQVQGNRLANEIGDLLGTVPDEVDARQNQHLARSGSQDLGLTPRGRRIPQRHSARLATRTIRAAP